MCVCVCVCVRACVRACLRVRACVRSACVFYLFVFLTAFYSVFLNIHRSGVLTTLAWLVPPKTAAVSAQVLCTPYNQTTCHFMQSHIRKVYACLAVTCHLHFWQNDRDLLRTTAVTRGGTDTEIRVSTESRPWRRKFSRRSSRDSNPRPLNLESGALTTELSSPPGRHAPCMARITKALIGSVLSSGCLKFRMCIPSA